MSDRLSGRVDSQDPNDQVRGNNQAGSRDDSPTPDVVAGHPKTGPIHPNRLHELAASLSDVDRAVIDVLSLVRMASGAQLNRLLWPTTPSGARAARRRLKRLTELRVVARLHRQVGGIKGGSQGYTYALDVAGQRLSQTRHTRVVRRPEPSDAFVDHTLGVTDIYVTLREAAMAGAIELEMFRAEPDCWRHYTGPGGRPATLKPDAYAAWLTPEWELLAFFEVDRGTEHIGRLKRKISQYLRYWRTGDEQRDSAGAFPSVVWVAHDERRAQVLRTVIADVPEAAEICVAITAAQLAGFITNTPREEVNNP